MTRTSRVFGTAGLMGALALSGCEPGQPHTLDNGAQNFGAVDKSEVTQVYGYTWDPEAMFYIVAMSCFEAQVMPPACPLPPLSLPNEKAGKNSVLPGMAVALFDPLNPPAPGSAPALQAAELAGPQGNWYVKDVPSRSDVPYFAVAMPTPGAPKLPTPDVTVPPAGAGYLPTMDLKPIVTTPTLCMGQPASMLTDKGILDAVARFLTATGSSTTVSDLLNPTKFGGVVVSWQMAAAGAGVHAPASDTRLTSDLGRVLYIDWIPPPVTLPEPAKALRSARGFIIATKPPNPANPSAPPELLDYSPLGISVVLLDPLKGPPPDLHLKLEDPNPKQAAGRPWTWPALPPMKVGPGMVSYLELNANVDAGPLPPDWACIPGQGGGH